MVDTKTVIGYESEKISAGEIYDTKITRITADLDTLNIDTIIRCLKTFKKNGFTENLVIRQSSSGEGYHIIAWSKKGVTKKRLLQIRSKSGDDRIRIKLDSVTGRQIQVLFTDKKKVKI